LNAKISVAILLGKYWRLMLSLFAATILLGCKNPQEPEPISREENVEPYWPTSEWRIGYPENHGLDEARLSSLVERLRSNAIRNMTSLLIVRDSKLIVEEYFNGCSAERVHTLQSVTKSVTSLLVGIALDRDMIPNVEAKVLSFFPEYAEIKNLDKRKAAMRLQDLLTMRTGLDWSERSYTGSPLQQLNESRSDWLRFVLDWPMREESGTRFE
jgi:CubicO group peptidase (beta-lactamase class C family)